MDNSHKMPGEFQYRGLTYSNITSRERLDAVISTEFQPGNVLLISYPKSGTMWTKFMLHQIYKEKYPDLNDDDFVTNVPALWYLSNKWEGILDGTMHAYSAHLPYQFLKEQVVKGDAKFIVVLRNPKDTLVSFYHFYRMQTGLGNLSRSWDDFFTLFQEKKLWGGDIIDFNQLWWEQRNRPNVLCVMYEDMLEDRDKAIRELSAFCEIRLSDARVADIVEMSGFEQMKTKQSHLVEKVKGMDPKTSRFFRKGKLGDWKEYFNDSQNEYIDSIIAKHLAPDGPPYRFE